MEFDPIGQYRPAPEYAQEILSLAPAAVDEDQSYLAQMAVQLDQMKLDAVVDAERLRPGLNGFFALVLSTGLAYLALYLAQHQASTLAAIAHGVDYVDVPRGAGALGIGLVAAAVTSMRSSILMRRVRRGIQAYERDLVARGGTPLPERGKPLHPRTFGSSSVQGE